MAENELRHRVRSADGKTVEIPNYTRGRAIKLMCTECHGWSEDPRGCTDRLCPLYPYRGKMLAAYHGDTCEVSDED